MMASNFVSSVSNAPASELISQVVEIMLEIVFSAKNVLIKKESFQELAGYLERVVPILKELSKNSCISDSESLIAAVEILNREVKVAKQLTLDCTNRNKVYLLMNCRAIVRRLGDCTREISQALGLLPLASLDLSDSIIEEIGKICDGMQKTEFKAAIVEQEILEKIETGIQERNVDRMYANELLARIAEAVGISTDKSALRKEFEDFKNEIENARLRKDLAEAIQMDQIIALLERADAASSPKKREIKYFTKRNSLGSQPLDPLQSFYCPITRDVMIDPVETSSGQTFERSAIEKWLAEGNNYCPLTMLHLDPSILRPNKTLRQSIEEWKDRNTMITIASMKSKLMSKEEEEVLHCLEHLEDLCKERDQHREWVILESYIPLLVQLLGAKNRDIRKHALMILCIVVKDSDDAKERVVNVEGAQQSIVRSLGRRIGEGKLAVELLLELSKYHVARESLGKVQGCIFLLVTMSSSDDSQAGTDAQKLLEILSFSDQNIVQMAKANYFRHLLEQLCADAGVEEVKLLMISTLAEMELTDHNKAALLEGGVLPPLLQLVSNGNILAKELAVKALRNLSSLPANGLQMIREGAMGPLLDLLFQHISSSSSLREHVSATVMNLALSSMSQESSNTPVLLLESDEDTFKLFSLITLTGPDVQPNILQTFHALCKSPMSSEIKSKLTKYSALQVLIHLCEHENLIVRANVVKLLSCLVEDNDEGAILEHVHQKFLDNILKILQSSNDAEEIASALGVISNLPENEQITQWLLEAGAIPVIFRFISDVPQNGIHQSVENAVGALCRFTLPTNMEWQKKTAEVGAIPVLVRLLDFGTTLSKQKAAISLGRFSESSVNLSQPIQNHNWFWCCSTPQETGCVIHKGICSVQTSFCLIEADAVNPLARLLDNPDPGVCEAALDALLTLTEGERLQSGSKLLSEASVIPRIIKFLGSSSPSLQEKSLNALERIFRMHEYKQMYGSLAQMPLVDLTQRGSSSMKSLAARILAHLNVLHDQSSYF